MTKIKKKIDLFLFFYFIFVKINNCLKNEGKVIFLMKWSFLHF